MGCIASRCFFIFLSAYRYVTHRLIGQAFVRDAQVWVSVGEQVLQGQALYSEVADNKPPVWEGVAILASATPRPYLILILVVGVGSALVVILVSRLAKRFVSDQAAVVAAVLVGFGILEATNGFINNKTLTLACLLAGLLAQRDVISGISYALAALIAQQILFALPVAVWWEWHQDSNLRVLGATTLSIPVVAYATVGLIWGTDALVAGLQQTILLAGDYATGTSQFETMGSPLTDLPQYIQLVNMRLGLFAPLVALAGVGAARAFSSRPGTPATAWLALGLTVLLAIPLGARVYRHYWLLPLIGAALLAAYGTEWLLSESNRTD